MLLKKINSMARGVGTSREGAVPCHLTSLPIHISCSPPQVSTWPILFWGDVRLQRSPRLDRSPKQQLVSIVKGGKKGKGQAKSICCDGEGKRLSWTWLRQLFLFKGRYLHSYVYFKSPSLPRSQLAVVRGHSQDSLYPLLISNGLRNQTVQSVRNPHELKTNRL